MKHLKRKKSQRVRVASEPSPKYLPSTVSVYLDPIRQRYVYPRASESQYNGLMALQIVFRVKPCEPLYSLGACMLCTCCYPSDHCPEREREEATGAKWLIPSST